MPLACWPPWEAWHVSRCPRKPRQLKVVIWVQILPTFFPTNFVKSYCSYTQKCQVTWRHDFNRKITISSNHHRQQSHNIWHNDTRHNDTQHNDTRHNDTRHNDIQHNNKKIVTLSKKYTQHNGTFVMLCVFYAGCHK